MKQGYITQIDGRANKNQSAGCKKVEKNFRLRGKADENSQQTEGEEDWGITWINGAHILVTVKERKRGGNFPASWPQEL